MARLSIKDIKETLEKANPTIILLSETYINAHTKLKCKCLIDGHEWHPTWNNLKKGKGCPKCGKVSMADKQSLTIEEVRSKLEKINPNIKILSNTYKNNSTLLECECVIDGNRWQASWANLSQRCGCPKCSIKNRSEEKHPNYNKKLTYEERLKMRHYKEYSEFLKKVLIRDNYTCSCCNVKGGTLAVHHLNGYHWDEGNRTNVSNGITLCQKCHKKFHKKYGYKFNTTEQFEDFKNKK